MKFNSQRGVALVITLIMLSVITVMAVAFLALTRGERRSVTGHLDMRDAANANNAGLESAKAHLAADILTRVVVSSNDWQGPGFTVSSNYINPAGFDPTRTTNWDNVNYDYYVNNSPNRPPLNDDSDYQQILANLIYEPRPPVFVDRFRNLAGPNFRTNEFRFYLDLNRNGRFDDTDVVRLVDDNNQPILDAAGRETFGYFVGDPQWIGILERPNLPHSPANKFIGRYCFVILPTGKTLDINFIHNHGKRWLSLDQNGYLRGPGHGSWELNLAAFLADLNTNYWNPNVGRFTYNTNPGGGSLGVAFQDASELLRYRYLPLGVPINQADPQFFLPPATSALPALISNNVFATDAIDAYADGLLDPTGTDNDIITQPWSGSENAKQFFSVHDLLDFTKTNVYPNFAGRLMRASTGNATSDRYTLYNLLAQMGTDSEPETLDKININYDDRVQVNPFGVASATNLYAWSATNFFMTVAHRLLRDQMLWERGHGFTNLPDNVAITNLEIYPTNYYTPAIHRLLQMAINIYDATTNRTDPNVGIYPPSYPTVLRPIFRTVSANNLTKIIIVGYEEASSGPAFVSALIDTNNWKDLNDLRGQQVQPYDFVYGIPLLIGAKQGYPTFNELMVETTAQLERKAEVVKEYIGQEFPRYTNQMYILGIDNVVGLEAWNSYGQNANPNGYYPRDLVMFAACELRTVVTNEDGVVWDHPYATNAAILIRASTTERWTNGTFRFPLPLGAGTNWINSMALTNSIYRVGPPTRGFEPTYDKPIFENSRSTGFRGHQWVALVTNRVRYFLFDNGRLVDAVSFAGLGATLNIAQQLHSTEGLAQWNTNRLGNSTLNTVPTMGLVNQIYASLGAQGPGVSLTDWRDYSTIDDRDRAIAAFKGFLDKTNRTRKSMQAPYSPVMRVVHRTTWQVNDPLVHYMAQDLFPKVDLAAKKLSFGRDPDNLGDLNQAYEPWGGNPRKPPTDTADQLKAFNYKVKDALVSSSDHWNFPTNKLPSIGWLGRVHRGTPWQTIYLKSDMAEIAEWTNQHPTMLSHPTNDWRLMDLFTVALHPNATRGQLSVNQTNEPAWSAVLSGATATRIIEQNGTPILETNYIIQPAALEPYVAEVVTAINQYRRTLPGNQFPRVGDVLAVTNLTAGSPFLHPPFITPAGEQMKNQLLADVDYERIPEQIMSLLKLGDTRYVIYTWGQSLKPAHVVTSGPHRGLVDNYQITGEVATRAVVRIEFEPFNNLTNVNYGKPNFQRPRAVTESFNIMPPE